MKVAFYKAKGNFFNMFIRWWDSGPYSHCELVFSDGKAASASFRDGRQVREKEIEFDTEHWDIVEIPDSYEPYAKDFLAKTAGLPYDLIGQIRFLVAPWHGEANSYWCSQWVAAALGIDEAWRYSPNILFSAVKAVVNK